MTLIFTWFLGVHQNIKENNAENNNGAKQQHQSSFFNELSNRALAILANATGHSGASFAP